MGAVISRHFQVATRGDANALISDGRWVLQIVDFLLGLLGHQRR